MARRSGLGRGLGALIPTEVSADRDTTLREVPLSSIKPNGLQPRTHFEEEAMSASGRLDQGAGGSAAGAGSGAGEATKVRATS